VYLLYDAELRPGRQKGNPVVSWKAFVFSNKSKGVNGLKVVKVYVMIFLDVMHLHRRFVTTYRLLLRDRFSLSCSSNCKYSCAPVSADPIHAVSVIQVHRGPKKFGELKK
jgi:hypothetical protein